MDEKRLIIAVFLSLAVLLAWQWLFAPPPPTEQTEQSQQTPTEQTQTQSQPATNTTAEGELASTPAEGALPQISTGELAVATEEVKPQDIIVETGLYRCVLTTAGGVLKSFQLTHFKETPEDNSPLKELITPGLPQDKSPLLTEVNIGGKIVPKNIVFRSDASEIKLVGQTNGASKLLTLTASTREGYRIEKVFRFQEGDYRIPMEIKISAMPLSTEENQTRRGESSRVTLFWYTLVDEHAAKSRFGTYSAVAYANDVFEKENPARIRKKGPFSYNAPLWAGFADSYFLRVIIPQVSVERTISEIEMMGEKELIAQRVESAPLKLPESGSAVFKYTLFLGPKEYTLLKSMGESLHLDRAVEYGRLEFFIKPLIWLLKLFHKLVFNWGLSIILLTVFVKLVFYPLTRSSYRQMKALQALQPRIKEIQEKYKDDRQKMNEEMMALYRSQKVNPLGGCLPMLLQLPILYALYRALYVSIELRHAEFVWWINDLSSPERLFHIPFFGGVDIGLMPIFMGFSMYVQQKMTPTTMDPAQAKIFMMMPIFFTFISFGFPSGLVLYWTVSNLLTIAQQYFINRRGA